MRYKGSYIRRIPDDYVVIDTETTGFDPNKDSIIEISALRVRNNEITDTFSSLVNPEIEIPAHITKITGISTDMVADAPLIASVLPEFLSFVGNDIILGHNVGFDLNFLTDLSYRYTGEWLMNDYDDTYYWAMSLSLPVSSYRLSALKEFFDIKVPESHRALSDCMTTKALADILRSTPKADLKISISETPQDINFQNQLFGKKCVITGQLEKFNRSSAKKAIEALGGTYTSSVSPRTDFLILGNNDYNPRVKDGKSEKHLKAEQMMSEGHHIRILTEDVFCDILKSSGYLKEDFNE